MLSELQAVKKRPYPRPQYKTLWTHCNAREGKLVLRLHQCKTFNWSVNPTLKSCQQLGDADPKQTKNNQAVETNFKLCKA